ncbi:lipopolysaccharide biosynthesis protein [Sphaerisporangium sp. B11E5]|uniref:lipopolysaccharide biosynthesis protein n=1 Tax=Sphaerisporangium sp. B11E5 TaxID=3153563 RepID=UPI00325C3B17
MASLNATHGTASRWARGGAAGVVAAVAGAGSQFLLVVVVTRAADTHTAGVLFTTTTLCLMTATVLRLDAGNGLVYFLARSGGPPLRVATGPVLACSCVVAMVVYGCADGAARLLLPDSPGVPAALRVLAVALPVVTCADVLVAATRGYGVMRPTVLLSGVLQPGGQLLLVGTAVVLGAPPWLLAAAWALPYLPVLLLSGLWLRRHAPGAGSAREFWRHTAPRAVGGAVQAVFQRLDIVVVAVLAGAGQAAVYTAATRFKVVGQLVNQGLAQAAQPELVRAMADGDLPRARELYQGTTIWLVVLTWPVWLGYAALSPWLTAVFGEEYRHGTAVALVLAATMTAATAAGMVDVVLIAAGHTAASMGCVLTAVTVTVAVDLALIPSHGALGAALGWSAGVLTKNLLPLLHLSRRYALRPFGPHTLPALRSLSRRPDPRPWKDGR